MIENIIIVLVSLLALVTIMNAFSRDNNRI